MTDFEQTYADWRQRRDQLDGLQKLFVVGCAKSGTTWLENMLQGHDQIVIRGEGRFFWQLAPVLAQGFKAFNDALPYGPSHVARLRDIDFQLLLRSLIDSQLARYIAESEPKPDLRVVGDKTPMHSISMPQLHYLYPGAKFIHIIRDPRDMTISQWIFWAKDNDPRPLEEFVRYSITKVWPLNVASARTVGRQLGDQYAEVRYEDLHTDEPGEVRRLLRFLGVDAGEAAVERCSAAGRFERHSGGRRRGVANNAPDNMYRRGVVGDWRNHLPVDLVEDCCAAVAPLMTQCGYEPACAPAVA